MIKYIFVTLFLTIGNCYCQSNPILLFDEGHVIENPNYTYFIDSSAKFNLEQIINLPNSRYKLNNKTLNLGICDKPVWLRLNFNNKNSIISKWVMSFNFPLMDSIEVYQKSTNGSYTKVMLGEMSPTFTRFYDTKSIAFPIYLPFDEDVSIYARVHTSSTVYLPMTIQSERESLVYEKKSYLYYGLFYGAVILILVYNFVIYFILLDKLYLLFCLQVITMVAIMSYFNGFISYLPIFNSDRTALNAVFSNSVFSLITISSFFALKFLDLKHIIFKRILYVLFSIGIVFTVLSFLIPYKITIFFASLFYLITPIVILIIAIFSWVKGNKVARFYVLSSSVLLFSILTLSMRVLGVITGSKFQESLAEIGIVINALLMAVALADKLKILRNGYLESQKIQISLIEEKERIVQKQNQILEQKIDDRTNEIVLKNEQLELYSTTIEQQNKLLQDYNSNLESQIQERTSQIIVTNKQLERKTERLEQFAYIVSHNLKSPVYNIDSVLNFIDKTSLNEENIEFIDLISKLNNQLKWNIEDINELIKLDKEYEITLKQILLSKVIEDIKDNLTIQLKLKNGVISTQINVDSFLSFPTYLKSILYNLIGNAIKYCSENHPPKIAVSSYVDHNDVVIKVSDNGKGIAENQLEHIFKLFYRIGKEGEGKGMGLYIVKSQVEQLGGTIKIESELNVGSTFTIHFPNAVIV